MILRQSYRDWQEAVRAIVTQLLALLDANNTWNGTQTFSGVVLGGSTVTKILTATAALDFGLIAAAASADLTITVTGAAVNHSVTLGLPAAPTAGIVYQAFVSAADTVTVRATNITAAGIDPASQTFRVTVIGF